MNSVVEKLAAIEREVAAIQPKMAPLTERIADLDQKVAGFAQQLSGIAEESAAVKQDIELTRQSLSRIQTLIGESKAESEQLVAGQEENLQRCETMTAVFGEAFQAVSKFFETAQRMGLADQAKAVFLNAPSPSATPSAPTVATAPVTMPTPHTPRVSSPSALPPELKKVWNRLPAIPEAVGEVQPPVLEQPEVIADASVVETHPVTEPLGEELFTEAPPIAEPVSPAPVPDITEESIPEPVPPEPAPPEPAMPDVPDLPAMETPVAETPVTESPVMEPSVLETPAAESILSESDFDSAMSSADKPGLDSWSVPGLPDVSTLPDTADADMETMEADSASDAIASHLDVPPLNLATPALPERSEAEDDTDDQAIEDLLATMMEPVTAAAN